MVFLPPVLTDEPQKSSESEKIFVQALDKVSSGCGVKRSGTNDQ